MGGAHSSGNYTIIMDLLFGVGLCGQNINWHGVALVDKEINQGGGK